MIYQMVYAAPNAQGRGGGIASKLAARKFPFECLYGSRATKREVFNTVIVFRRDDSTSDAWGAPTGMQRNPKKLASRFLACECLIYAKSSVSNANDGDHEWLAEQLVDGVTTAIQDWVSEEQSAVQFGEMRYLRPEEIDAFDSDKGGPADWPGRVYRIKFSIGRAVNRLTYLGEAEPTGMITGVRNRTEARLQGASDSEPPTIGCNTIDD